MPSIKHVHKYYRFNKARNPHVQPYIVYECRLGDCTHFLPIGSILGKRSICWDCGKIFFLDSLSMQIKPRCSSCRKKRPYHKTKNKEHKDIDPMGDVDALLDSLIKKET